jgi:hypothetical protein
MYRLRVHLSEQVNVVKEVQSITLFIILLNHMAISFLNNLKPQLMNVEDASNVIQMYK